MEFDSIRYYEDFSRKLKIRESTCYDVHIDGDTRMVISCTDFGHIVVHNLNLSSDDATNRVASKTLMTSCPPVYCSAIATFSMRKFLFCGGRGTLLAFSWDTITKASHNDVVDPDINFASTSKRDFGNIVSVVCISKHNLVFAATDYGRTVAYDVSNCCSIREILLPSAHSDLVHSLKVLDNAGSLLSCDCSGLLCIWDYKTLELNGSVNLMDEVAESIDEPTSSTWVSSMDISIEGNFLYIGGGMRGLDSGNKNAFHKACSGWIASFLLVGEKNDKLGRDATLVNFVTTPVPSQKLHLQDDLLLCAGPQPLITYRSCHNLECISTMETSSQSIFAISSYVDPNFELMAIAGTVPIIDLVSLRGSKEAVLCPL